MIDLSGCTSPDCPACELRDWLKEIKPPDYTAREHVNWIRSLGQD